MLLSYCISLEGIKELSSLVFRLTFFFLAFICKVKNFHIILNNRLVLIFRASNRDIKIWSWEILTLKVPSWATSRIFQNICAETHMCLWVWRHSGYLLIPIEKGINTVIQQRNNTWYLVIHLKWNIVYVWRALSNWEECSLEFIIWITSMQLIF